MIHRPAFALRDGLAFLIAACVFAVLAIPALSQVRIDSSRQACIGNYRFIAQASASYTNDFAGQMWALSWKRGMLYSTGFGSGYITSDIEGQAFQANDILRRLSGAPSDPAHYMIPSGWVASLAYSHAALADYVNQALPASYLVCPEDWARQRYLDGDFSKLPSGGGDTPSWRTPLTSSYVPSTYQWGPSRQTLALNAANQLGKTAMWYPSGSAWNYDGDLSVQDVNRPRLESEVRFPSSKVFLSDDYARHVGTPRYYAYQSAAQDLLFYDGSVRYFRTDSTNPGWNPTSASSRGNMKSRFAFTKQADFWGGLDNGASSANFQAGWYRWTRGGLYGWDVPRLSSMVGKLPSSSVIENEVDTSTATGAW